MKNKKDDFKDYPFMNELKKIKQYNKKDKKNAEIHLQKVLRNCKKKPKDGARVICVILAYLWDTEKDESKRDLLLEATWMATRMSSKLESVSNLVDEEKYI